MGCCQSTETEPEPVYNYPRQRSPSYDYYGRQESHNLTVIRPSNVRPPDWNSYPSEHPVSTTSSTSIRRPPVCNINPVQKPVSIVKAPGIFLSPVCDINPVEVSVSTIRTTIRRPLWDIHELLAETKKIDKSSARNIVQLFDNKNTIPFICRYRRDLIGRNITPDKLRDIQNTYTEIVDLQKRVETVISDLEKVGFVSDEIRAQILSVKTVKELEFLHALYKPSSKSVRALGLENHANRLLIGDSPPIQLQRIVDRSIPELSTIEKVKDGICQVISQQFSKHTGVLSELRRLQNVHKFILKCTENKIDNNSARTTYNSSQDNNNDQSKYEKYFKFQNDVRHIKPHQILAINRGENSNCLSVQVIVKNNFKSCVRSYIYGRFMCDGIKYALRNEIFEKAFEECYIEKLFPLVYKEVRTKLTEAAKKEAVEVFAKNLKQLLLMPPLKGERILGIDPGFRHGCKLALISETANLLAVSVLNPHNKQNDSEKCGIALAKLLSKHNCKIIALGNGTACRETESWLRELFDRGILDAQCVNYVIVSEQGASVYSCSPEAKKEFPNLDVNLISAVSIARRLNDPLSEYAKIEPRHLGIGMYQHDINEKFLTKTLSEVVSECVSFVGVDVNTASLCLLKHIAGLNESRAENIIQYREKYGPFRTRNDLLRVPTMEEKAFVQCAGFIRIEPKSVGGKLDNVLDCTWVHPESYTVATKIIAQCNLELKDIGKPHFISKIKTFAKTYSTETLVTHYSIPTERVKTVLEALQRELFQDYRRNFDKKLFKREITRIEDLFIGEIVTGEVRNVVHFGAFVDIGLEQNALIHKNKMNNIKLKIGDRVTATVLEINMSKRHTHLRLDELI